MPRDYYINLIMTGRHVNCKKHPWDAVSLGPCFIDSPIADHHKAGATSRTVDSLNRSYRASDSQSCVFFKGLGGFLSETSWARPPSCAFFQHSYFPSSLRTAHWALEQSTTIPASTVSPHSLPDTHGQVCHKYPWPGTTSALVSAPTAMIKHQDHKQLGEEAFTLLTHTSRQQALVKGQEPGGEPGGRSRLTQRPWRSIAYCLVPRGLVILLPYSTQGHQLSMASPTVTWALSNQPSRKCTIGKSGDIISVEVPSSEVILICVMLP